jgi:hypothetical protein
MMGPFFYVLPLHLPVCPAILVVNHLEGVLL